MSIVPATAAHASRRFTDGLTDFLDDLFIDRLLAFADRVQVERVPYRQKRPRRNGG
jgi:hypothetical protein